MKINLTSMQAQRLLSLARNARPSFDDDAGLVAALERLIADMDEAYEAAIHDPSCGGRIKIDPAA